MIIYARPGESTENISYIEPFELPEGFIIMAGSRPDPGYYADDEGTWLEGPSPPKKLELIELARLEKARLIGVASDKIETLKDRIEAGQDKADELKLWKAYRIALDDVDVSAAPDIEWPVAPE
ncbi:tail fiber assembly protein [Yersinia bercovieri]|uniref:tail fiber assembly protein n=1 Tax=Yersinia bercovieri TaxID=634 RepID=UPI0011A5ED85|nr:tail fiber assembly protein [Yersinia bercovieri]